ncbi:hypothetical protein C8A05DRAFT_13532 [Staphylotrichum tortipilum]|uniref:Shugoshin n=1 Tax=Staphylotrichum tortipilum TaxID=2831512 RepID=A0AAN6MQD1_9PEZI|nr:hypothetical protein C8A05DRAFT_13532 [Staphylotrichum longicolle]
MARLNEPPAPVESHLEILRRKFLRQNRDIAKINSDQSLKIRRLENDCARLLSENLDLRGQILRLEKQLEDSSARRIADQALEVKAKLEAQLSEFAALLGGLGVEPPAKRRSSEERILAKNRRSIARSPPQRRRRDTGIDAEALAEQEGRLPPIYENKSYPRATMNSADILALCAAAEDTSDSPDLGPPPVSRFIEDEPVKHSPPRVIDDEVVPESPRQPSIFSSPPKLDYDRKPSRSPEPEKESTETIIKQASPTKDTAPARKPAPAPVPQPIRAGAKRKYGDENGINQTIQTGKENSVIAEKPFPTRGGQKRKSLAEAAGPKQERRGTRTPLASKSTNADVSSPRKMIKAVATKGAKKEHTQSLKDSVMRDVPEIPIPVPEPPAVVAVMLETATSLPSAAPSSPTTPGHQTQAEAPHDTPPPADISSTGEMSRPSRRVRAAISYAEPNLRDKMRRPTKELFDAVAGEGKFVHRGPKPEDHPSAPTSSSKARTDAGSSVGSSSKSIVVGDAAPDARQQTLLSPLAQKEVFSETLASTVVMERRKRPSAVRESLVASIERPASASPEHQPTSTTASPPPPETTTTAAPESDIYDFTASSPTTTITTEPTPPATTATTRPRPTRKSSMAAAAALHKMLDDEENDDNDSSRNSSPFVDPSTASSSGKTGRAGGRAKRASMLVSKSGFAGLEDEAGEGRGRRRSMML